MTVAISTRYAIAGAVFGLIFPLVAFWVADWHIAPGDDLLASFRQLHRANPLLWIIDTAPVFLGALSYVAGLHAQKLAALGASLEERVARRTEDLRHAIDHDGLTEVFSRQRFEQDLTRAIEYVGRYKHGLALMFVDVDDFKKINDTYGHRAGDAYLKETAAILRSCLRKTDSLGRWAGDEFACILPETSHHGAVIVAKKIIKAMATANIQLPDRPSSPSVSLGIALLPPAMQLSAETLINMADMAMYEAKREGKGCWRLYESELSG